MSSLLFSPVSLGHLQLKNRIVVPPMCQYSANNGKAGNWHVIHYGQMALGTPGLIIVEATGVVPEGRISPNCLGIWDDETAEALADMVRRVKQYGLCPMGIQLAHAGRKASTLPPWLGEGAARPEQGGWTPVAPSALPFDGESLTPRELTGADIEQLVERFADAAKRADKAGFDLIEIHGAHGYLLHEFLSPLSNKRTDEFGGSLENRMRFPLQVLAAVRKAFPASKPVGVRVSGTDWVKGGWNIEDTVTFAKEAEKLGCAFIHVSSGGLDPKQAIHPRPGYQTGLAAHVKSAISMPVITVGLITNAEQAESMIVTGQADLVAIGRAMLFNPHWPWQAAMELGASVQAPLQYLRSQPYRAKGLLQK